METFKHDQAVQLQTVAIRIKNREKMLWFYRDLLGFSLKREENELAILGTAEENSELIWLEETPYAETHFGEIKKLQRLCLVIPTEAEMGDLMKRLVQADYPIKDALYDEGAMGILVEDPEENQLELYFGTDPLHQLHRPEALDVDQLLDKATGEFPQLSDEVAFDKVHLNTSDLAEEYQFLQEVLGLEVRDESQGILVLNAGCFHVGLAEGKGGTLELSADRVLGLDFLKFSVSQAGLNGLVGHLRELKRDFYVDKKQSILTIYDPAGIEWWFKVV